jgi:nitrite reductase (NO-forming)
MTQLRNRPPEDQQATIQPAAQSDEAVLREKQSATRTEEVKVSTKISTEATFPATNGYKASPQRRSRGNGWFITCVSITIVSLLVMAGVVLANLRPAASLSSGSQTTSSSTTNTSSTNAGMGNMDMSGTSSSSTGSSASTTNVKHQTYNAVPPAAPAGNEVNIKLIMKDELITIASGIVYHAWTFNGTVPGPVLRVRQGQTVHTTLVNEGTMAHSIDFHAAQTPWNVNYQSIEVGKSFTFTWKANYPGVFMYHCGTPTVIYHMANGMYGTIIVDPANGWTPAQEYSLTQSEFYTTKGQDGTYSVDPTKMMNGIPDYVVFNGYASQYQDAPLKAKVGQRIRLFLMNAGPTQFSAFHVIGAIFSDVYVDGNPANRMVGNQTVTVPPGGGVVVELTIPEAGSYPFVTHSFANASKGAVGVIKVER